MTNRDMMIMTLKGEFDDYGAEEANIYYYIDCPYVCGDKRCECKSEKVTRELCIECKYKWLDSEVDE
jgi:hypothetical protein